MGLFKNLFKSKKDSNEENIETDLPKKDIDTLDVKHETQNSLLHENVSVNEVTLNPITGESPKLSSSKSVEELIECLKNQNDERIQAIEELGNIGGNAAVNALASVLANPCGASKQVALALRKIGDRQALDTLIAALEGSDTYVKDNVAYALAGTSRHPCLSRFGEV